MATFVLAHGAWSSAWAWKKVRPLLRARGHDPPSRHSPNVTAPEALAELLVEIARTSAS
jgi:hypothetical protein